MSLLKKQKLGKRRRTFRVRNKVKAGGVLPRVSVFRSLKQMYAQLIDDAAGKTVASCSSLELKPVAGNKKKTAHAVGLELAKRAKDKGVVAARFDRGPFQYHGRVEAIAQGLRDGGLKV